MRVPPAALTAVPPLPGVSTFVIVSEPAELISSVSLPYIMASGGTGVPRSFDRSTYVVGESSAGPPRNSVGPPSVSLASTSTSTPGLSSPTLSTASVLWSSLVASTGAASTVNGIVQKVNLNGAKGSRSFSNNCSSVRSSKGPSKPQSVKALPTL